MIIKLNKKGRKVVWATYLGAEGFDRAFGLATDPDGGVTVGGRTDSPDFPTVNPVQPTFGGGFSYGWGAHFVANGQSLDYSTYLRCEAADRVVGVKVNKDLTARIVVQTS